MMAGITQYSLIKNGALIKEQLVTWMIIVTTLTSSIREVIINKTILLMT